MRLRPTTPFRPAVGSRRIEHQCKNMVSFRQLPRLIMLSYRSSNFKRQNTIDSATIKENTARVGAQNRPVSAQPKPVSSAADNCKTALCIRRWLFTKFLFRSAALASPVKPRSSATSKFDPSNGNRTVGPSGMIPRRSTTLYEKTSSTEKTNVLPAESKYDHNSCLRLCRGFTWQLIRNWQNSDISNQSGTSEKLLSTL